MMRVVGPFVICTVRTGKLVPPRFWIQRFRGVTYVQFWRTQYSVRLIR